MNTALTNLHRKLHIVMQTDVRSLVQGKVRRQLAITTITPMTTSTTVLKYMEVENWK